ncbi:hypothetical protein Aph01nite_68830 [Acrocarpospora phusangensis]|uniref:Probable endolytic peptidoglycan transglycosylase RlpA n=1 Tax=Acrocarpospora phusangensis TaxID=1070424 RepID=A0A919QJ28_9ACTN|nr:hypothetical protein Aph01nite_68830 [Acrocarpospora phusangensis]
MAASDAKPSEASPAATPTPSTVTPTPNHAAAEAPSLKVISTGKCGAAYYDEEQNTASGERFNPDALTAAHRSLPMNSKIRVINPASGDSVVVRINDRGPWQGNLCLDLSRAAFNAIGDLKKGMMRVHYEVLG